MANTYRVNVDLSGFEFATAGARELPRDVDATSAGVAAKRVLDGLGIRTTRFYGTQRAPLRLPKGARIRIDVERIS